MGKNRRSTRILTRGLVMILLLLSLPVLAAERPVVVIDPGHGGSDAGITGSYGTLEKDVTLALALEVRYQLGPLFDVRLTRESDRNMSLVGRVERANSVGGELLLSIHTGGGLSREANPTAVFVQYDRADAAGGDASGWSMGHRPYISLSRDVATDLKRALMTLDGYDGVELFRVPLRVSDGARMPVVLVEVGNLSNPRQENRLVDTKHLQRVASALVAAIEGFFAR